MNSNTVNTYLIGVHSGLLALYH